MKLLKKLEVALLVTVLSSTSLVMAEELPEVSEIVEVNESVQEVVTEEIQSKPQEIVVEENIIEQPIEIVEEVQSEVVEEVQMQDAYADSSEQKIRNFIKRLYNNCLDREPETGGWNYWTNQLLSKNLTASSALENFLCSEEFERKGVTDSKYAEILYTVCMDRKPDQGGLNYWIQQLQIESRKNILAKFAGCQEFTTVCNNYGITKGSIACEYPSITGFTKGTGTVQNPYIITRANQFKLIEDNIEQVNEYTYFALGADISLQGIDYIPIGERKPFRGHFDGRGHKLINLSINQSDDNYAAMFARTAETATIVNINLEQLTITNLNNQNYTAGLVGLNEGTIENCHVKGLVKSTNYYTGGLVAENKGIISSSSFEGTCISSKSAVGGLVGGNSGTINGCYAKGDNTGGGNTGGLIGENYSTVLNSYVNCSSNSNSYTGGLIGYSEKGKIYNCYALLRGIGGYRYNYSGLVGKSKYDYFDNCYTTLSGYVSVFAAESESSTFNNCYGSNQSNWGNSDNDRVNCERFSYIQMQKNDFVQLLNSHISNNMWKKWTRNDDVNDGLPYFMN